MSMNYYFSKKIIKKRIKYQEKYIWDLIYPEISPIVLKLKQFKVYIRNITGNL